MTGTFGLSEAFDSIGGTAKSAADLAQLTELILTSEVRSKLPDNGYLPTLNQGWERLSIGFVDPEIWVTEYEGYITPEKGVHEQTKRAYEAAIVKVRKSGGRVVSPIELPEAKELLYEGRSGVVQVAFHQLTRKLFQNSIDGLEDPRVYSLTEFIRYNEEHVDFTLPITNDDQHNLVEAFNSTFTEKQAQEALQKVRRVAGEEGIDRAMDEHQLDLVVAPSESFIGMLATAAGYPCGVVPLGNLKLNHQPFGITVVAKAYQEEKIFRFMGAFESTFPERKVPCLLASSALADIYAMQTPRTL